MRPPFCPPVVADDANTRKFGGGPKIGGLFGRGGPFTRARGARMFDSGALRLVTLGLIAEEPRHGYDIIKGLKEQFQGAYSPSPGSIYPLLQLLEEAGLVSSQSRGPRRLFTITDAGKEWLAGQKAELDSIKAQVAQAAAPMAQSAIGEAIHQFRATLYEKMRGSALTDEQADKLRQLLEKARNDIEKI